MRYQSLAAALAAVAVAVGPVAAQAQEAGVQEAAAQQSAETPRYIDAASPFGASTVTNEDAANVRLPVTDYVPTGTDAADFDKYYFFHRADTDFATAYADIAECDGYARGLQSGISYAQTPYNYSLSGAVGGAIGTAIAIAIFGSAEKRRLRRVNMRACMNFKGYDRYGLSKQLWDEFNFEEGLSSVANDKRQTFLKIQALVASSSAPKGKVLGL